VAKAGLDGLDVGAAADEQGGLRAAQLVEVVALVARTSGALFAVLVDIVGLLCPAPKAVFDKELSPPPDVSSAQIMMRLRYTGTIADTAMVVNSVCVTGDLQGERIDGEAVIINNGGCNGRGLGRSVEAWLKGVRYGTT
jgi:hypothetical protein